MEREVVDPFDGRDQSRMTDTFDPVERAREKQASRERDELDLKEGRVTREELSRRNGFFSSLDVIDSHILRRDDLEKITTAAIEVEVVPVMDGYPDVVVVSAPRPFRHHHIMHQSYDMTRGACVRQGFLTSTGRFVDREEAMRIALESGETFLRGDETHPDQLFSEDLW